MTQIVFYQLAGGSAHHMLPTLLEKSRAQGWRAVIRTTNDEIVAQLDRMLWVYRDDSFLPHGCARDGSDAADQPIWLTTEPENPNKAEMLVLVDDAEAFALDSFKRCLYLFDGQDEAAMKQAQKRKENFAHHEITFWRQSSSGWVKD